MEITVTIQEIMEKGSVDLAAAMKMIGCGRTVIFEMIKDKTLPIVKQRSRKKIPVAAIEKYLVANLVQAGTDN